MVFEIYDYLKSTLKLQEDIYLEEQPGLNQLTVNIKTLPGIDCKKEHRAPKYVKVTATIHSGCALYSYKDEVDQLIKQIENSYPKTHSLSDLREFLILKAVIDNLKESELHYNEYNPWSSSWKKH